MGNFREAIQISIISIGIVFAALAVFNLLIQLMGSFFAKQGVAVREAAVPVGPRISDQEADEEKAHIAAIMAAFREEFGDQIAEIKITRKR